MRWDAILVLAVIASGSLACPARVTCSPRSGCYEPKEHAPALIRASHSRDVDRYASEPRERD